MKRFSFLFLLIIFSYLVWIPVAGVAQESEAMAQPQIKIMTTDQLVSEAKKYAPQITPQEAQAQIDSGSVIILDVREADEFKQGHLPGALLIPRGLLEFKVKEKIPDQDAKIIVYCKVGGRGALAAETMKILGYKNVENIEGGWEAWLKDDLPVE